MKAEEFDQGREWVHETLIEREGGLGRVSGSIGSLESTRGEEGGEDALGEANHIGSRTCLKGGTR